jgi:hypothetical protein
MPSILRRDRDSTSAAPSSPSTPRGLVVQAWSAPAVSCRLARRGPQQLVPRAPSGPEPSSSMSSTWLYRMERAGRRPTRRELADHARPEALSSLPELVSRPGWSTPIPARSRASPAADTPAGALFDPRNLLHWSSNIRARRCRAYARRARRRRRTIPWVACLERVPPRWNCQLVRPAVSAGFSVQPG